MRLKREHKAYIRATTGPMIQWYYGDTSEPLESWEDWSCSQCRSVSEQFDSLNSEALKWPCFNQVYHQKPHAINIIRSWYRELRGWEEALAPVNETRDLVPGCSNISTVPRGQASLQRPSVNGFIALWLIGGKYQNLTMLVSGRNSEVNFQKVHEFFIDRRF